jgi:hypothetical protein
MRCSSAGQQDTRRCARLILELAASVVVADVCFSQMSRSGIAHKPHTGVSGWQVKLKSGAGALAQV